MGKRDWKKRTYTSEQKALRREWQRAYDARPDVRLKILARKRAKMKTYYLEHRDEVRARNRAYAERNNELVRERRRDYYIRNRDRFLTQHRLYRNANRERLLDAKALYRERNRERLRQAAREYSKANRHRAVVWGNSRRARVARAPGTFTSAEFERLVGDHGGRCAYCGVRARLTVDHRIPLCRTELAPRNDITNILPACFICNSRKGRKTEDEYRAWLAAQTSRSTVSSSR